ncbi:MAG: glycosyltransferase family 4 protein [Synechococcus sp.]
MNVGYLKDDYLTRRNILYAIPDVKYSNVYDVFKLLYSINRVLQKMKIRQAKIFDLGYRFNDFHVNHVDVIHFFNTISYSSTPWVTTFETIIPRFKSTVSIHKGRNFDFSSIKDNPKVLKALDAMASGPCLKLMAMSECNLQMQRDFLAHFPQYRSEIERKLVCLPPPQEILVDRSSMDTVSLDDEIRFMFVGSKFFRKGGVEILESFQEARRVYGYNLKLLIVSSLSHGDYATDSSKEDTEKSRDFIRQNNSWIDHWDYLENRKVLELMKTAHVGLLPTYADSYGFSVLEFQAAGCPVISTNIRALPEINNNDRGWLIELPQNSLGEAIYTTKEDREAISNLIKQGLLRAISEIMDNRQIIYHKAKASVSYIKEKHSPKNFSRELSRIYGAA